MTKLLNSVFVIFLLSVGTSFGVPPMKEQTGCGGSPSQQLQGRMFEEFTRSNPWNYQIVWLSPPHLDYSGLTYSFGFVADFSGRKIQAVDEAERVLSEVYKWNLSIANSFREIRPFLNEFPMTPRSFQITVGFLNENDQLPDPPYIASVVMRSDQLEFNHYHREQNCRGSWYEHFVIKKPEEYMYLKEFFNNKVPRSHSEKKS